ncbi:MAG: ribosome silencing factor [Actinomycetota bacterium]|nr:ribosome silencing factor [Actinomycetota bacterium]
MITPISNKETVTNKIIESVKLAARIADEKQADYIKILDMRNRLVITDYFLIISAKNVRLTARIFEDISKALKDKNIRPVAVNGVQEGSWILADYDDFVIHIFTNDVAQYYELERLWKDSEVIDWNS